jgi:hypothetical protein
MFLSYFKTVGVGILLVEKNNDDYEFILVYNKKLHTYDIPGGRVDNDISEMETGQKELYEETLGLFKIKKLVLFNCKYNFFIRLNQTNKLYKIFIIMLNRKSNINYYTSNYNIINSYTNILPSYKETNNIIKLKLSDFINKNYKYNIRPRDYNILRILISLKWLNTIRPNQLKLYNNNKPKYPFLQNIKTYYIY